MMAYRDGHTLGYAYLEMGAPRRLQPARGRGQPDRYANVDAPKKKQKLSRAEQRRCSAQPPPPHRVLIPVRAVTAHWAHAGTVALPPCQSSQLGGRATILGTWFIESYHFGRREHAKTALAVHIVQGRSGASAGYLALAHAPACAHRMHFRATRGVNLRTLAVRRFARCHG